MTGRKKRGEPEYKWVDQLNRRQLEGLAKKLIKGKGEYTEEEVRKVIKRVCKKNKPLGQDLIKKYRKEFENLEKDYFEETEGSSDTDSLGSLDGDQDESLVGEVRETAVVTDQRSRAVRHTTQG